MRIAILLVLAACADQDRDPPLVFPTELPAHFPPLPVPPDNPMTQEKIELGRHLFYDARLSANGTQSCASCHRQELAFTDGGATSLGATGERGRRSAMSLANIAYAQGLTWDARIHSLEEQALVPMYGTVPIELGLDPARDAEVIARLAAEPRYAELFPAAFPDDIDPITIPNVTRALATFERTLISGGSRVDQFFAGDDTALDAREKEARSRIVGNELDCLFCHDDGLGVFGGEVRLFNTGLYNVDGAGGYPASDRGYFEVTGVPADMGRFRPPTLRNIAVTGPYHHDGSTVTLEDVLDTYARGGRLTTSGPDAGDGATNPNKAHTLNGFTVTGDERVAILAFLRAFTDEAFLVNPAFSDPW